MLVVSPKEMARLESLGIKRGASSEQFMEKAGKGVAHVLDASLKKRGEKNVCLITGKGNNAGDAFVAGTYLLQWGYHVQAFSLFSMEELGPLCSKQHKRFVKGGGKWQLALDGILKLPSSGLLVDGIFGTGFDGSLPARAILAIEQMNMSPLPCFAVDIPSGLNGQTGIPSPLAVQAFCTLFLGLPKTGFFLEEGWNHVGNLQAIDFGLDEEVIRHAVGPWRFLPEKEIASLLPSMPRNRHKYQAGLVVGIAGSKQMPGAAMLASSAALRAGAGLVRLIAPKETQTMLAFPPEIMHEEFDEKHPLKALPFLEKAKACFIGPGLGRKAATFQALHQLLKQRLPPAVIDADALAFLAQEPFALLQNCVLTPHAGEMAKLLSTSAPNQWTERFLQDCQGFVDSKSCVLLLKGSPSWVLSPTSPPLVIPRGDPGMATAGCGDVLCGVVAGLLAQGLNCVHAALLGAYLHAVAGEKAAAKHSAYALTAHDVIDSLGESFKELLQFAF